MSLSQETSTFQSRMTLLGSLSYLSILAYLFYQHSKVSNFVKVKLDIVK